MRSGLQILSRRHARTRILKSLRLVPNEADSVVWHELVRSIVWTLTRGRTPVHVLRLLNRALDAAQGIAEEDMGPEALRAELRGSLNELAMSGDLAELDAGMWLPAPSRLVAMAPQDDMLFVGGLPTRLLNLAPADVMARKGPFRFIRRAAAGPLSFPVEDMDEWARRPDEPLQVWAAQILALPLLEHWEPTESTRVELYLPERAPAGTPQFKRWSEHYGDVPGIYLARRTRAFGTREFRIVEVLSGRIARSGAVLARGEARRLMYALDLAADNRTRGRWTAFGAGGRLVLTSVLPYAESRIFAALGVLTINPEKLYEQPWAFVSHGEHIQELVNALSIQLNTQ